MLPHEGVNETLMKSLLRLKSIGSMRPLVTSLEPVMGADNYVGTFARRTRYAKLVADIAEAELFDLNRHLIWP